jgi:lipocalin-like protein
MKMNLLKLTPAILLIVAFTSCKKDSLSKTDLLTDPNGWLLTALTIDPAIVDPITGAQIANLYAQYNACEKDDIIFFKDNGTIIYDEGATKCDPNDPQTGDDGTWLLSADEKTITIDGDSWTISELSKSNFRISFSEVDSGITYTYNATFTH